MMGKRRKQKHKAKIIKALSPPKSEKAWAKWLKSGNR